MEVFLGKIYFKCQEIEFMKTKWKEGNSYNIPVGTLLGACSFVELPGHN